MKSPFSLRMKYLQQLMRFTNEWNSLGEKNAFRNLKNWRLITKSQKSASSRSSSILLFADKQVHLPFPPILQVFCFLSYFALFDNFGLLCCYCRSHGCFSSLLSFDALNLVFDTFSQNLRCRTNPRSKPQLGLPQNYMHNTRKAHKLSAPAFDSFHFDEFQSYLFQKELSEQIIFVFSGLVSSVLEISTLYKFCCETAKRQVEK